MHVRRDAGIPVRPLLPPSACAAAATIGCCALAVDGGWASYVEGAGALIDAWRSVLVAGVACALLAISGLSFFRTSSALSVTLSSVLRFTAAGCLLGMLASAIWLVRMSAALSALECLPSPIVVTVFGDASQTDSGWSSSGVVSSSPDGPVRLRISSGEELPRGSVAVLHGAARKLPDSPWGRSRFARGEIGTVSAKRAEVTGSLSGPLEAFREAVLGAIGPKGDDARALCAGIVCGHTTYLSGSQASDAFSACGLSHLVAVSGGHLVLLSELFRRVLAALHVRRSLRIPLLAAVCCAYAVFTGCAPSAVRSAVMVLASSAAAAGGRRPHGISGLSVAAACMAVADPGCVFDMGFQLSVLSVLFLGLFSSYVRWHLENAGLPEGLSEALSCTLCAQWATIPLTVPVFGEVSLISPLANLLVAPLMNGVLSMGIILFPLSAALPPLEVVAEVVVALARSSIFLADLLAGVPAACIGVDGGSGLPVLLYGAAAIVYIRWKPHTGGCARMGALAILAAMLAWVLAWTRFAPAQVVVMDVGQADAILIRDGSSAVLVDAGVDEGCARALARSHVYRLDAVMITHWDRDHCGGLEELLRTVAVDRLIVAEGAVSSMPDDVDRAYRGPVEEIRCGDAVVCGRFLATAMWPLAPVSGDQNADSIVLSLDYRDGASSFRMLLCGDAEAPQTNMVADAIGDIDVLKLGHHGSRQSVDDPLMVALTPEVAIASAGEGNPYGHPDEECAAVLERHAVRMLCTAECGDITVEPDDTGPRVTWRHRAR